MALLLCFCSLFGRELEKWEPDNDHLPGGLGLEEQINGDSGWDQFEVNERKFGVKTTFDEHIYTSRVDKSKSRYTQEDAERIAAEIRSQERSSGQATFEQDPVSDDKELQRFLYLDCL